MTKVDGRSNRPILKDGVGGRLSELEAQVKELLDNQEIIINRLEQLLTHTGLVKK